MELVLRHVPELVAFVFVFMFASDRGAPRVSGVLGVRGV
jgi:hypothetical protein